MSRQQKLPFPEEPALEVLWDQFPAASRQELVMHYARLLARLARESRRPANREERVDEPSHG
jgi:hypothetical protein